MSFSIIYLHSTKSSTGSSLSAPFPQAKNLVSLLLSLKKKKSFLMLCLFLAISPSPTLGQAPWKRSLNLHSPFLHFPSLLLQWEFSYFFTETDLANPQMTSILEDSVNLSSHLPGALLPNLSSDTTCVWAPSWRATILAPCDLLGWLQPPNLFFLH